MKIEIKPDAREYSLDCYNPGLSGCIQGCMPAEAESGAEQFSGTEDALYVKHASEWKENAVDVMVQRREFEKKHDPYHVMHGVRCRVPSPHHLHPSVDDMGFFPTI
jgi:hypothetical protein